MFKHIFEIIILLYLAKKLLLYILNYKIKEINFKTIYFFENFIVFYQIFFCN